MVYLFAVQDYTGYNFSISDICYLIGFAQDEINPVNKNEKCLTDDFNVRNPDVIMNKAFELAGHDELTATATTAKRENQQANYTNITCQTDLNNLHHVAGDSNQNIIYNPWENGGVKKVYSEKTIYIYINGEK